MPRSGLDMAAEVDRDNLAVCAHALYYNHRSSCPLYSTRELRGESLGFTDSFAKYELMLVLPYRGT